MTVSDMLKDPKLLRALDDLHMETGAVRESPIPAFIGREAFTSLMPIFHAGDRVLFTDLHGIEYVGLVRWDVDPGSDFVNVNVVVDEVERILIARLQDVRRLPQ